jgi:hypothetical protein
MGKKGGGGKAKAKKNGSNKPKGKGKAGGGKSDGGAAPEQSAASPTEEENAEREAAAERMMAELLAEEVKEVELDTGSNNPVAKSAADGSAEADEINRAGEVSNHLAAGSDSNSETSDESDESDSDDDAFLLLAQGLKGAPRPTKEKKKGRKKGKKGAEVEIKTSKHAELLESAGTIRLPMQVLETILSFVCSGVPRLRSQSLMEFSHLAANGAWEVAGLKDAQREQDRRSRPRPRANSDDGSITSTQTATEALQVQEDDYYDDSDDDEYYTCKASNRTFAGQNRSNQHKVTQKRDTQIAKRNMQRER